MRKIPGQIKSLFIEHTPAHSRSIVQTNLKLAKIQSVDDKKLEPMIHYLTALQKHKQYLDFFQIGVVRDQRKKLENVARYVGLAIRDYSHPDHKLQANKDDQNKQSNSKKVEVTPDNQLIKNWVGGNKADSDCNKDGEMKQTNEAEVKQKRQ